MQRFHPGLLKPGFGRREMVESCLERDGNPILVCRGRTPAAALVSLKDYQERFVDREADDRRRAVVARLKDLRFRGPRQGTTLDILRDLRS